MIRFVLKLMSLRSFKVPELCQVLGWEIEEVAAKSNHRVVSCLRIRFMLLLFAPLIIVLFVGFRELKFDEVTVTLLYFLYSVLMAFFIEVPTNSRTGALFGYIPSLLYLMYVYPHMFNIHNEDFVRPLLVIGFTLIVSLLIYFKLFVETN